MNDKPHVHKFEVRNTGSGVSITYGDQQEYIWDGPLIFFGRPTQGQIRRKQRAMVKRHDRESKQAAAKEQAMRDFSYTPNFDGEHWPSEGKR